MNNINIIEYKYEGNNQVIYCHLCACVINNDDNNIIIKNLPGTEQTALDVIAWRPFPVYRHI